MNNWVDSFFNTNDVLTRNEPLAIIAPEQRPIVSLTLIEAFPICCLLVSVMIRVILVISLCTRLWDPI